MNIGSRFRVGNSTRVTFYDDPEGGVKTGTLLGMARTPEIAGRVVQMLNVATDPDLMIQALVDSGLTSTEIVARVQKYRQDVAERGVPYPCPFHGSHPHKGLVCARCSRCWGASPNARSAAHDLSDVIVGEVDPDGQA